MRGAATIGLALWLGGCLYNENSGTFEPPPLVCPDPGSAALPAQREICIIELLEDLAEGPWIGDAESGVYTARCRGEFGLDGTFRLTSLGDGGDFPFLFFPSTSKVEGKYVITDLIQGEFFGRFETNNGTFHTRLDYLSISGDVLTFTWRTQASDFSLVTSQLVLTRRR